MTVRVKMLKMVLVHSIIVKATAVVVFNSSNGDTICGNQLNIYSTGGTNTTCCYYPVNSNVYVTAIVASLDSTQVAYTVSNGSTANYCTGVTIGCTI